jgi:hypothetical protein
MSRSLKRILLLVGGVIGLLVIVALALPLFVDANRFKPQLEAAASDAMGMDVRIGGRLGMGLLPGLHVWVEDARILGEQGVAIATVRRARLAIDLIPLLYGKLRLRGVELEQPVLSIELDPGGRSNIERLNKAGALLGILDGARVSLSDGILRYADARSGAAIEATGLDLKVSRMRLVGGKSPRPWKALSLKADFACGEFRATDYSASNLKMRVDGKSGIFKLEPITMAVFGGQMTAGAQVDLSGPVPACQIRCSLPNFRIEEFFQTLSPKRAAEGAMDFSASLSMQGGTLGQLVQTAAGEIALRGRDLTLVDNDLDLTLSRFEASQSFNLVDVGAVFLAGPLGVAVSKGYNFATLFQGSGGNSRIVTLVSEWKVEHGVAQAQDVALATGKNRLALQGGLDFVNERFLDVTVAVIDAKGCATVRQVISGSFASPVVEKPRILRSLAGPVLKLYRQTRALLPSGPCESFYSGSVAPPE